MRYQLRLINGKPTPCLRVGQDVFNLFELIKRLEVDERIIASDTEVYSTNVFHQEGLWNSLKHINASLELALKGDLFSNVSDILVQKSIPYFPPIPCPPLIFGLAGNCPQTWRSKGVMIQNYPVGYVRPWTSLVGHNERVILPKYTTSFRCAVELGVIIEKPARNVHRKEALDYIAGFTIVNDMIGNNWNEYAYKMNPQGSPTFYELLITSYYGRGSDGFAPIGPYIVSKDEINNLYDLMMFTYIGDKLVDRSYTNAMIVGVENAIEYLSGYMTLLPGSVIHMGTMGRDGWTIPADIRLGNDTCVALEIEKIGTLKTYFDDRRGSC